MLEVCLCKLAIYKLKILGRGKFEFYKSMGEPQKGGGGDQIFKVGSKRGDYDFWLKFSGGKNLGGNYVYISVILHLYFLTFFEMKYASILLLSLKRNTLFRKSTSNTLLNLHINTLESLLEVYFRVSK